MKSIKSNTENEYIIKKSKFITKLYKVSNENDVINILNEIKKNYKDSTHICYGYIINNTKRFSDDFEPSGTAGIPILKVLENNQLNNILCIVIRYFGGIKLGAGGLIRAYSNSVSEALNKTEIINLVNGIKVEIIFTYESIKKIDNILDNFNITNKEFSEDIKYIFLISNDNFNLIKNNLNIYCKKIIIKENTLIEVKV